ncbi:MAG: signal peptide peptidase SppA [Chloroflexi bacterium]|nr:signal peptide peptidase SppA [Chloroflexota bacterium]
MPLIPKLGRGRGIAVVEVYGTIGGRVRESVYARLFSDVATSKRYRALLLDIQSPGGSAAGSELLYYSLKKVAAQKPVVAHIRNLGASGGYYLACAANRVTALPTSLVGSIGVIYARPILEQLLAKAGVEFSVVKGGRLKDMGGFWRGPTEEESEKLQELIGEVYENFLSVVKDGRSLPDEQARELATGELFTARRGRELGLVDDLIDFEQSLQLAAQLAGIESGKARPRWLRPRRALSEKLTGRPANRAIGANLLGVDLQRLLNGGLYYLEPSALLGSLDD